MGDRERDVVGGRDGAGLCEPVDFWEDRYAGDAPIWSGEPNRALTVAAAGLPVGRALDLGCGEGGDSIWLAEQGWRVTGVDIATTAVARARAAADERGVPADRLGWVVADLATWQPTQAYDLVSACFLHSPVDFPRAAVLQRAAAAVAPGGHLLVVGHAEPPPWATAHDHGGHRMLTLDEEVTGLRLDEDDWVLVTTEVRERLATGPDGEPATLRDTVVLAHRG